MIKVAIGVQARSTSTRLPGKSSMFVGGESVVGKALKACLNAASYITNRRGSDIEVDVYLLTPTGDPLALQYQPLARVVEGDEMDVLSRYGKLVAENPDYDYICRVTGDCPLIPPFLITKHIVSCANYKYDYCSNVDIETRTHPDGWDCEVMSRKMLCWLMENATTPLHREHVTSLLQKTKPAWARIAHVVGYLDNSSLKISVDTQKDLEFTNMYDDVLQRKLKIAKEKGDGVFRL